MIALYAISVFLLFTFYVLDKTESIDEYIAEVELRYPRRGPYLFFLYAIFKYTILAVGILIPIMIPLVRYLDRRSNK